MTGQKNYFGKDNIRPEFLRRKTAKSSLKSLESSALKPAGSRLSGSSLLYTGVGQRTNKSTKFSKRRSVPALLITALFGFAGFFIASSPSILGPHMESLFTEATDTQYSSARIRSKHLVTEALDGKIKLTSYMKGRLEKSGITVTGRGSKTVLHYNGHEIDSSNFKTFYNNDPEFRKVYTKAKRGRVANFFDDAAESIYKKLGLSRNVFSNYRATGDGEIDEASYRKTMTDYFDNETDTRINTAEDRPVKDDDGNETIERTANGEDAGTKTTSGDTPTTKARSYLESISGKVASANIGCAVLKVGSMISVAVAANEIYQSINYFMTNTENISKMKYGEGDASATNQFLNLMTTTTTSKITDMETGEEISVTGAPLESEGSHVILGGGVANKSKTKNYSLERTMSSVLMAIGAAGLTTTACNTVRAAGAIISLSAFAIPGGGLIKAAIGMLLDTTLGAGMQIAIGGLLGFLIPTIAKTLFTNTFEGATGIPAGELYAKGASAANTRVGRSSSGQSPASAESILAYNKVTAEVLAEDAELDRKNRSPFDITSKNTFLGSIVTKLLPINNSASGVFNHLANFASKSLNPLVSASGENSSYMTTFGDCPTLEKIGAKGDIYCNPITTTDLSIIDIETDDKTYQDIINPNLEIDSEGNEKVKDNSTLANYIMYCTERDSPFGVLDANIASAFETSLGVVGDNLPILNDIIDIVNAAESEAAEPWATGSICVNSSSNPSWDSEMKYYQRYIEDTRIKDQMGIYEDGKNPVTAFKEHYYEQNPLDNSRAGYLSRISGLTKEDAETVIAISDYYQIVDEYDPSLAYSFINQKPKNLLLFKENTTPTIDTPKYSYIYFNYKTREELV